MRLGGRILRQNIYRSELKSHVTFRAGGVAIWPLPRRLRASPGAPTLSAQPRKRQDRGIFKKVRFVDTNKTLDFVHWISGAAYSHEAGFVSFDAAAGRIAGKRF